MRKKKLGKYKILVEKHRRVKPYQRSDYTEVFQPGDIIEVVDVLGAWLELKDGGYVCGGFGKYAEYIGE